MNNNEKKTLKNILLTGSIVAGSVIGLSGLQANATETFKYSELGSGAELRTELLQTSSSDLRTIDMSCGEDSKKDKKEMKQNKAAKAEKADKAAKADKKEGAAMESKSTEQKCGEGKCGAKDDKANDKKTTKESKTKDASCGESNFAE